MSWVYIESEPGLYTVGFFKGDSWHAKADYGIEEDAERKCHYLNGGSDRLIEAEARYAALASRKAELAASHEELRVACERLVACIEGIHGYDWSAPEDTDDVIADARAVLEAASSLTGRSN